MVVGLSSCWKQGVSSLLSGDDWVRLKWRERFSVPRPVARHDGLLLEGDRVDDTCCHLGQGSELEKSK